MLLTYVSNEEAEFGFAPLIILMTAMSLKATPMYTEMESRRIVVIMKLSSGPLLIRALKDERIRLNHGSPSPLSLLRLSIEAADLRSKLKGVRKVEDC